MKTGLLPHMTGMATGWKSKSRIPNDYYPSDNSLWWGYLEQVCTTVYGYVLPWVPYSTD